MKNILEITRGLEIPDEYVIPYGFDKAKIDLKILNISLLILSPERYDN